MRTNAVLALSLVLGVVACNQQNVTAAATDENRLASPTRVAADPSPGAGVLPTLAQMLARVSPAVVNISVQGTVQTAQNPFFQDPLFRRFFGLPEGKTPQDKTVRRFHAERGYVITNNHVVNRADKILITLKDRRQLTARLVAADPQTDVAVG